MHLLASDGRWLAMKGVVPEDEIAALPLKCQSACYREAGCAWS